MDSTQMKVIEAGLFFFFIFLTGVRLSRSGRPYHVLKFNLHKLIGLAALIFLVFTVYQIKEVTPLSPLEITACAVTGLLFACTIIAGGLVSIEKPMPAAIPLMHKIFPYLTVLATAVTLFLLLSHK